MLSKIGILGDLGFLLCYVWAPTLRLCSFAPLSGPICSKLVCRGLFAPSWFVGASLLFLGSDYYHSGAVVDKDALGGIGDVLQGELPIERHIVVDVLAMV